jgi:chromosome segregation ATPase
MQSETTKLHDELHSTRSQLSTMRKETKDSLAKANEKISQLDQTLAYERQRREKAEHDIKILSTEKDHVEATLRVAMTQLEEARVREQSVRVTRVLSNFKLTCL